MKIVVIGAGSIGANIAYRLQQQGAQVVLVDAGTPGSGTSGASIAWLSMFPQMAWNEERGRATLRPQVNSLFAQVQQEVPGDYVSWPGTLLWGAPHEREEFGRLAGIARERGVDVQTISGADARKLDPAVSVEDDEVVFHEPNSGWVDAPAIIDALVARFGELGGELLPNTAVARFEVESDNVKSVVTGNGDRIEADHFVNAAGSWASHVAAAAGLAIPLNLAPGRLVWTKPLVGPEAPRSVINTPAWCGRPDPSGSYVVHWRGHSQTANHGENTAADSELIEEVAKVIPAVKGTVPTKSKIGIRAIPPGGPIVGGVPWLPNLYFAVSHGGIGWGPMWGMMAAREILHDELVPELAAMRPERFYLEDLRLGRHADDAEVAL